MSKAHGISGSDKLFSELLELISGHLPAFDDLFVVLSLSLINQLKYLGSYYRNHRVLLERFLMLFDNTTR